MKVTQKISLDFAKQGVSPRISVVQGDLYTRLAEISLTSNGEPWRIPNDVSILIRYRKPDRTFGTYDTLPDGTCAYAIRGNTITIAIAPDALALPGDVPLVISLVSEQQLLSTFEIILAVQPNHAVGRASEGAGCSIAGVLAAPESAKVGQVLAVEKLSKTGAVQKIQAVDLPVCNTIVSICPDPMESTAEKTVYQVTMTDGTIHTFSVKTSEGGADGKSAYEYAKEGGFIGTETEFAEKLAAEPITKISQLENDSGYITETPVTSVNGKTGAVQIDIPTSDWNASEGEAGHVLNRTHYKESEWELLHTESISHSRVGVSKILVDDFDLYEGNKYKVVINGDVYEMIAYVDSRGLASLGAPFVSGGVYDTSVYPFTIFRQPAGKEIMVHHTLAEYTVEIYLEEVITHKLGSEYLPTPDCNAKEGEPGYIANRTHYTEVTNEVVLFEDMWSTKAGDPVDVPLIPLVIGNTYKVTLDGIDFFLECTKEEYSTDYPQLGVLTEDGDVIYNDFPFYIRSDEEDGTTEIRIEKAGLHTLRISEVETVVHRLDEKYLPENVARVSDIPIVPTTLKNPNALTINGTSYDGSTTKDFTAVINAMIDTKLGVIENGTY